MNLTKYQKEVLETAKRYYEAGCNVVPARYGDKDAGVYWKQFQNKRPSLEQVIAWFSDGKDHNIAMLGGKTSGNSIPIGFNDPEVYKRFFGDLDPLQVTRIHNSSPGRYHAFVKTNEYVKLEMTHDQRIEIRGEGSITVIPPSIHPKTRVPYRSLNPNKEIAFVDNFWDWAEENSFRAGYLLVNKKFIQPEEWAIVALKGPILKDTVGREPLFLRLTCLLLTFWDEDKVYSRMCNWNKRICQPPIDDKRVEITFRHACKEEYKKSREKRKKEKTEHEKTTPKVFDVLEDGSLIDLVYDNQTRVTQFAIFRNDEISYIDRVEDRGKVLVPQAGPFIEKGLVKLPSGAEDYSSRDKLVDSIQSIIHKYIQLPSVQWERFISYYILMTWLYDRFSALPYLRFTGGFSSGKTRAEHIIGHLTYRGVFCGGSVTTATLFRVMDLWKGTLVIDEAEFRPNSELSDALLQVYNIGYKKGGFVIRNEKSAGGKIESVPYEAFGPKILASRTSTEVATESRMITITMSQFTRKDVPAVLPECFDEEALRIRNQLLKYRFDHYKDFSVEEDRRITDPRLREMLVSICTVAKGDKEFEKSLAQLAERYHKEMGEIKSESLQGVVATLVVSAYEREENICMRAIMHELAGGKDWGGVRSQTIGSIVRKELGLSVTREMRNGTREHWVDVTPVDIERLRLDFSISKYKLPEIPEVPEHTTKKRK